MEEQCTHHNLCYFNVFWNCDIKSDNFKPLSEENSVL